METHSLNNFFNPSSIAVIGASDKPDSAGFKVFSNLLMSRFAGKIYPVNPQKKDILGQPAFQNIRHIAEPVDLAVIITPAPTVASILLDCGQKNIRAAIILSAGFGETGKTGSTLEQEILNIASQYHIRIIGPNCLGMMRPSHHLNITFESVMASTGTIAFVSQSGGIMAGMLDWAAEKQLGFSTVASVGNAADIGFGEILDFLATDHETKSILLYIEGIHDPHPFIRGLKAATNIKPVIVIKAGRHTQGSRAAQTHTGALIADDDIFDSVLRQAGVIRVMEIEQLYAAADIFSCDYRAKGNRLAIITNGGGAGVIAADRATEVNIELPECEQNTLAALNDALPSTWSHQNPIDIIGDATPKRYHKTIEICIKDKNIDGLLIILIPVAMTEPLKVAEQLIAHAKKSPGIPIIACWMGGKQVSAARTLLEKHRIPCFDTPEQAVDAFSYLVAYHRHQQMLKHFSPPPSPHPMPDIKQAHLIIESALSMGRTQLTITESKAILKAFNIPITQSIEAASPDEAFLAAETIGFPIAMKINSPDITHKQDAGGVVLNISNTKTVKRVFTQIMENAKRFKPNAKITGVTIERMYHNPSNRELLIGVKRDNVFGPAITLGVGGIFTEIIRDRTIALPPLNQTIITHMITGLRSVKMLLAFRNLPAINMTALTDVLLRLSEMVCALPYIQEMDINPLIVNEKEAIAVDARFVVGSASASKTIYPDNAKDTISASNDHN